MKDGPSVMIIGLDPTPATSEKMGDLTSRLLEQSEFLRNLFHICRSKKEIAPIRLSENLTTYPVSPPFRALYSHYAFKTASEIIKRNKVDVVYTQDPFFCGRAGLKIKKKFKIPVIMGMHADILDNPFWLKESPHYRLLNLWGKHQIKKADLVRAVSHTIKENLVGLGVPEGRIITVPTGGGVDVKKFSKADGTMIRERYGGSDIILFVGRLAKQKNLALLLDVAERTARERQSARFLIAGDGPERGHIESLAKKRRISNVEFLGRVPFDELPEYYAASDVVALPSNYEGLPKTVEEAFASGKPVVSTAVSGSTELVMDGKTGYLVGIRDSQAFSERLLTLLSDKALASRMGSAGRDLVAKSYDRRKNLKKMYSELYERGAASR